MDCFIVCNRDFPEICAQEVKELIGLDSKVDVGICLVKDISKEQLATLAYHCQSAYRIAIHLTTTKTFNDNIEIENNEFLQDAKTFKVEVNKLPEIVDATPDIQGVIGATIKDALNLNVNLTSPDRIIYAFINKDNCYIGLDICGFAMGKRQYKLFNHAGSLHGPFAYTLLRLAGVTKDSKVVDPFCGSGTIPIEAALFQNQVSPFGFENKFIAKTIAPLNELFQPPKIEITKKDQVFGYDHLVKVILNANKNAKLAGINDATTFSKVAIDWIDAKFEENEVDFIITDPPKINKRTPNEKQLLKMYDELFYQAKYLLKQKGTLGLLFVKKGKIEEIAQKHQFTLTKKLEIHHGEQEFLYLLFNKSK